MSMDEYLHTKMVIQLPFIIIHTRSRFCSYHSIDQAYVYGVSLTHGQNPRKHIWTFAGAVDETSRDPTFMCPCINQHIMSTSTIRIPSFIGSDYFCDTSLSNHYTNYNKVFYPNNPLWDGSGCGAIAIHAALFQICICAPKVHRGL